MSLKGELVSKYNAIPHDGGTQEAENILAQTYDAYEDFLTHASTDEEKAQSDKLGSLRAALASHIEASPDVELPRTLQAFADFIEELEN